MWVPVGVGFIGRPVRREATHGQARRSRWCLCFDGKHGRFSDLAQCPFCRPSRSNIGHSTNASARLLIARTTSVSRRPEIPRVIELTISVAPRGHRCSPSPEPQPAELGVFAAYVSRHGHAFIDRALYLPKGWTDDPARLKATSVPDNVSFSTKPQLAVEMIERALAAGVPFRWVAADSVYGVGDIERNLRQAGKGYVLGVNSNHWFASWGKPQRVAGTAEEIAKTQRRSDWRRLSAGAGTKGPRLHDWCYLELADLEGEDSNHHSQVLWTRGLLIRRNIANGDLAYFTTWCPAGTSIKTLVSVEGHRWAIEDSFETAKNEFGLDHNESRSWHGWHRHVSLVMLAFAMMAAIQHQANKPAPKKTKSSATPRHPTSSVGRSRKSAA